MAAQKRNTNAHANKTSKVEVKEQEVKKARVYAQTATWLDKDGNEVEESCETTCKTWGACFYNEDGNLVGDCLNCTQDGLVKALCVIATDPDVKPVNDRKAPSAGGFVKQWQNGMARGGMRIFISGLVSEGAYTRKEIMALINSEFPDAKKGVAGLYIGHGMKGKGKDAKRFDYRIIEVDGLLKFDAKQPKGSWGQE